jgi:MFS family permease
MLNAMRPVRSLLFAVFLLTAGCGSIATLVGVRLAGAGVSAPVIGLVGAAFFLGLTLGSLQAEAAIRRVGHIRAFAVFVSLLSASTLAYALRQAVPLWAALRLLDGFCLAGVYVCVESWLNDRAGPGERGAVLAGYMVALYAGQGLGQFLLRVGEPGAPQPFQLASILVTLAVLPVALTRQPGPPLAAHPPLGLRRLYAASPLGTAGTAAAGVMLGAFYSLAPVYARRLGLDLGGVAGFMSAAILGGVVLQWPLGRLSDRFDRRAVVLGVFAGAGGAALGLALLRAPGPLLAPLAGVFGGLSFALYPLCVAHTHDHLAPAQRVGASAALVLVYSAAAAIGPPLAAAAMAALGPGGLFLFVAACAAAAAWFGVWRLTVRASPPEARQQSYQALPGTTPMSAVLDPHARADL